jgi:pilus assembly protein CpaE
VSQIGSQSGQASVETVAMLPLVLLAAAVAWQLLLTGQTLWLCANAARSAARAELVGESPRRAALSALPLSLQRGLAVTRLDAGGVRVGVRLPLLVRAWRGPVEITASASLGDR